MISSLDSLPLFQKEALENRIEAVVRTVSRVTVKDASERPRYSSGSNLPLSGQVLNFVEFLEKTGLSEKENLGLSFLTLFGEYASQDQIQASLGSDLETAVKKWLSDPALLTRLESKLTRELVPTDPSTLYVDVSHTAAYPFNTGIQRVVRKTVGEFAQAKRRVAYFSYTPQVHGPQPLTQQQYETLLAEKHGTVSSARRYFQSVQSFLFKFFKLPIKVLKYLVLEFLVLLEQVSRDIFGPTSKRFEKVKTGVTWFQKIDKSYFLQLYTQWFRSHQSIYLFFDSQVLLPELTNERSRPQFYVDMKIFPRNSLTVLVYDLIPIQAPEICADRDVWAFTHYLRIFSTADRLIGISKSVEDDVRSFSDLMTRKTQAPLLVSHIWLAGDFLESNEKKPIPALSETPRVLCVGTVEKRKNQTTILRAADSLRQKGLRFEICFVGNQGAGGDEFFKAVSALDPEHEFVRLYKNLSDQALLDLYRTSHFSIFCSLYEGFGLPILESLRLQRPVITSNRGSMREIAERVGGCELVDPEDQGSISQAMERLLLDPEFYQKKKSEIRPLPDVSWSRFAGELYETCQAPRNSVKVESQTSS